MIDPPFRVKKGYDDEKSATYIALAYTEVSQFVPPNDFVAEAPQHPDGMCKVL